MAAPATVMTNASLSVTQVFSLSRPGDVAALGNISTPTISEAVSLVLPAGANAVFASQLTIAPAGNSDVDFSSFANQLYESLTPGGIYSLFLVPTGVGAQMRLSPGASNPLTWFFGGTTPSITVPADNGAFFAIGQGTAQTIDSTHKVLNIANPGSTALTVVVLAFVGQ